MRGKQKNEAYWSDYIARYGVAAAAKRLSAQQAEIESRKWTICSLNGQLQDETKKYEKEKKANGIKSAINNNLTDILHKFGGLPKIEIRVTFQNEICDNPYDCPFDEEDEQFGDERNCAECEYGRISNDLDVRYAYTFTVRDGDLRLVLPDFTSETFENVIKVEQIVDGRPVVVWEREKEEQE